MEIQEFEYYINDKLTLFPLYISDPLIHRFQNLEVTLSVL